MQQEITQPKHTLYLKLGQKEEGKSGQSNTMEYMCRTFLQLHKSKFYIL